jgi:hypothetical protein
MGSDRGRVLNVYTLGGIDKFFLAAGMLDMQKMPP